MKKPKSVRDAEAAANAKKAELDATREVVRCLEKEWFTAMAAVRSARAEADAALPSCRLVRVNWRGGNEEDFGRAVILRRTPSGMLIVRNVGDSDGEERRFKWVKRAGEFRQDKNSFYGSYLVLRDVPAEYLPKSQAEHGE